MLEHWFSSSRYQLLRSSDDAVNAADVPKRRFTECFALRRIRTTLLVAALLLVLITLVRIDNLASPGLGTTVAVQYLNDSSATTTDEGVNWSDFAYVQYVTNGNYLCNSLMILEALHHLGAKADRIMLYPEGWKISEENVPGASAEGKLLMKARDLYQAKLVPIQVQSFEKGDATWKDSYTKLLAFNQTQYKRVMSLDSDATVRMHMDELFLMPSSPVAMPRAYWLKQPFLSSQLVLIEPSPAEWHRVQEFMKRDDPGFDMDILNSMYKESCAVIPHRQYALLSGEFRSQTHEKYLGSDETWDGAKVLEEAKFVHFSDWPVPKPWIEGESSVVEETQPKCRGGKGGKQDCTDRDIWLGLYRDFTDRRQEICGRRYDK